MLQGPRDTHEETAAAQALGLVWTADGDDGETEPMVPVWPGQEPAARLFQGMLTQWRMGPAGPVGLDYGVISVVARGVGLRRRQAAAAFEELKVMEDEALAFFAERKGGDA